MASLTQWTWVWANSRRWWRTGKPGVLQSIGSQRVRHHFTDKGLCSQSYGFSSSYVCIWELDIKKEKYWRIDAFELWGWRKLESPLDSKKIKPVNPKGNQPWIFIGRADAEAPILWPPDVKNWLIGKDPDAAKDWRWEEKGTTEGEMVKWHHWLNGHEFEQAPGDSEGQGSLACCSPQDRKEANRTERLNNNPTQGFCVSEAEVDAFLEFPCFL